MIQGLASTFLAQGTASLLMARAAVLNPGQLSTTLYVSDTQFEHLGPQPFTRNPLIKAFSDVAQRNPIATQTAAVFTDELLRQLGDRHQGENLSIQIVGDIPDTPAQSEMARFEKILDKRSIPVEGFNRGNHSSANAFGVINSRSRLYRQLRRTPLMKQFSLREEVCEACGDERNLLTAQGSFQGMYRILHRHREDKSSAGEINLEVARANYDEYQLAPDSEPVPFDADHLDQNFHQFWRPSEATVSDEPTDERRYWEVMVNYQVADIKVDKRDTQATPFYIQASEQARFALGDGTEVPVYSISLDGLDNGNFLAINSGVSELQVRLVETFIEKMLQENPNARFKLSSHFSSRDLLKRPWRFWRGRKVRKALKRLLSREEVVLFTCGHTHERHVVDLNKKLRLKRLSPLMEINVPSLIDYHPAQCDAGEDTWDARALVVEQMYVEVDQQGKAQLKIDLQYRGLNREDITPDEGRTKEVEAALKTFKKKYGYIAAKETASQLRTRHAIGWMKSHGKRFLETVRYGIAPFFFRPSAAVAYWRDLSIPKYLIDNLTVASTVSMFSDAYYLTHFLASLTHFIVQDGDPEELAVVAQLTSLRTAIIEERMVRKHEFEHDLAHGERAKELRKYNDLYQRTRAHMLSDYILALKPGGQGRAFAILAGIDASREEFEYHKKKPSKVPNKIPTIEIPLVTERQLRSALDLIP